MKKLIFSAKQYMATLKFWKEYATYIHLFFTFSGQAVAMGTRRLGMSFQTDFVGFVSVCLFVCLFLFVWFFCFLKFLDLLASFGGAQLRA
jgi:hypothetical protein